MHRACLAMLCALAVWPESGSAQQQKTPVLGFLASASERQYTSTIGSLRRGLNEAGYVEKKNLLIEYRWANGQRYRGDWSRDQPNGKGSIQFPNGDRYSGDIRNGLPNGTGTLVFANGAVMMSAALDAEGRMLGGILEPVGRPLPPAAPSSVPAAGTEASAPSSMPAAGTEAALRRLVAGLASGSPDYDRLSPQFAQIVRRDLPMTHAMFNGMGELRSVTFRGRGERGDDIYDLVFANGGVTMSAVLDADGRIVGGILRPAGPAGR